MAGVSGKNLRMDSSCATMALMTLLLALLSASPCSSLMSDDGHHTPAQLGLLVNFSVPCDLNSAIAVPDQGGLLTPVLLGLGYQEYRYNGSSWKLVGESALLFNKTLAQVGTLFSAQSYQTDGSVTFKLDSAATVTAITNTSVAQAFSIPLQLLSVTGAVNESTYSASDFVQRFGTQAGLPPASDYPATTGQVFKSGFSAFYAFFLPFALSPQLATRVPRCGDERFYGLQYGRTFP